MTNRPLHFGRGAGLVILAAGFLVAVAAGSASAQPTARPFEQRTSPAPPRQPQAPVAVGVWEFEVYGGSLFGGSALSGTAAGTLPNGTPFTTAAGFPSRAVSSWYFGDGAALFGQVTDQFAARFGQQIDRITALDGVLTGTGAGTESGAAYGVRVSRRLSPRLRLEIGVERGSRPLRLTDEARALVQAASNSFQAGFTSLLNTVPQTNLVVTSTSEVTEPSGGTTTISGVLALSLVERGPLEAHVLAGAGGARGGGGALDVQLSGSYQFLAFGVFSISENDMVTVRLESRDRAAIGIFGGGISYDVSARHSVRVEYRLIAGQSGLSTTVSASPIRSAGLPGFFLPSLTDPSIQFSNTSTQRTSLSGERLVDLETFKASGLDLRGQLTAGFVFRF